MKENKEKKSLFVKNTRIAADFLISLAVIAISIIFIVSAAGLPTKEQGIGPGEYPTVVSSILLVLGVYQLIKCVVVVRGIPLIDFASLDRPGLVRFFIMVVVTYVFYKLLRIVGFPILAPIYLFFTIMFFGYKNKVKAAVLSIVFTTTIYLLFTKVFLVMLPAGILG